MEQNSIGVFDEGPQVPDLEHLSCYTEKVFSDCAHANLANGIGKVDEIPGAGVDIGSTNSIMTRYAQQVSGGSFLNPGAFL
ncbi:hypothetical protein PG987_012419 [Apiospora arundinis]